MHPEKIHLLPSQAFFLLGSILNLPGLKFYLLYCEQGKTRPHDRTASELGKNFRFCEIAALTLKNLVMLAFILHPIFIRVFVYFMPIR